MLLGDKSVYLALELLGSYFGGGISVAMVHMKDWKINLKVSRSPVDSIILATYPDPQRGSSVKWAATRRRDSADNIAMRGFIVELTGRGPRHLSNIKTLLRDVTVFSDCWLSQKHPQRSSTRKWLLLPGQKLAPEPAGQ